MLQATMKLLVYSLFGLSTLSASAAFITYQNGITNVQDSSGPAWVDGTNMFRNIITDFVGSAGPTGATGFSSDLDLFNPGLGGMDITLLTWSFSGLTLFQGAGSLTQSPGVASPGFEDYRYDDQGGIAAHNLEFYYDGDLWVTGYITNFVTTVANNTADTATGAGEAQLLTATLDGQMFLDEINGLTNNTGLITFTADNFDPVAGFDPASFSSNGAINIVPEPGVTAAGIGAIVLGAVLFRRRK